MLDITITTLHNAEDNNNNNNKENKTMNKTYTITRINNDEVDQHHYAILCPVCHRHFIIDSVFDSDDTDVAFLSQPMCHVCHTRFIGYYSAQVCGHSMFDGFIDIMTGEGVAACHFPPKAFVYYPANQVYAAYKERTEIDNREAELRQEYEASYPW